MSIENEDMKRRWEKRERMRRQAQKQRKRLIIGLIAAGIVLVAAGVLIFFMSVGGKKPAATTPAVSETPPQDTSVQSMAGTTSPGDTAPGDTSSPADTTTPPQETMGPDTTVIRLAAAGDFNVTDKTIASGGTTFNYTTALMDVVPLLSGADITVMNFEGNLIGAPYDSTTCSAPQSVADGLYRAGVDLVQVANSQSLKNGMSGLRQTISNFRLAGIEPLGAYGSNSEAEEAAGYTLCTVRGVKIAFIAFTKGMDSGVAMPSGSDQCINVLYTDYDSTYRRINSAGIRKIINNAKEEEPDIIVALVHWGSEYNDSITDSQKDIRDLMFREGVDAIIGTHSHYLQAMEFNEEKGTFVAYSLGDFMGDGSRAGTAYSAVLELEITKDNRTKETKVTGYSYTPIYTTEGPDGLLRVMRLESAIADYENKYIDRVSESVYEDMKRALTRIDERIHEDIEAKKN